MKYLIFMIGCLQMTTIQAQWRVISVSPASRCLVKGDGKILKKGDVISPQTKIIFQNLKGYVHIYRKGAAPFMLSPNKAKSTGGSELMALAHELVVPKKERLSTRGAEDALEVAETLLSFKMWLTGASADANTELVQGAKPVLFFGNKAHLYVAKKAFTEVGDFYLVYLLQGKKVVYPLVKEVDKEKMTLSFDRNILPPAKSLASSKSALFFLPKEKGAKPVKVARFRPMIIENIKGEQIEELKEVIQALKEAYGQAYKTQAFARYKRKLASNRDDVIIRQQVAQDAKRAIFEGIYTYLESVYEASPDRNSLKKWLKANFPKLFLPYKKK
ncbi:hypothetical protein [Microscilla marina]|uniref:Uncharacterized protein n=1 Tax=Microscilla marina ATCC 23134 TaxID=313606 RepID=A1ZUL1_MICM2|nr:hypothetical protein [Microscilla marina]EAY25897.1 hypothetical protein M23134_00851 [Microscilla marina ATCC 23134]